MTKRLPNPGKRGAKKGVAKSKEHRDAISAARSAQEAAKRAAREAAEREKEASGGGQG